MVLLSQIASKWIVVKTFLVSRIHIFLSLSKVKKGYIKFREFCKCSPGLSHIDHDQMLSLIVSINSTNTIVPATLTLVKLDSKPYHHICTESFPVNIKTLHYQLGDFKNIWEPGTRACYCRWGPDPSWKEWPCRPWRPCCSCWTWIPCPRFHSSCCMCLSSMCN